MKCCANTKSYFIYYKSLSRHVLFHLVYKSVHVNHLSDIVWRNIGECVTLSVDLTKIPSLIFDFIKENENVLNLIGL